MRTGQTDTADDEIDRIADRFEDAWKRGQVPAIDDHLAEVPAPLKALALRALVRLDVDYRHKGKQQIDLKDYLLRFPQLHLSDLQTVVETINDPPAEGDAGSEPMPGMPLRSLADPVGNTGVDGTLPDAIGSYKVLRRLASEGQAEVYLAYHVDLQREVAIKVLHAPASWSAAARNAAYEEARVLSCLEVPGIARVFDVGEHAGRPYLVMEYIPGPNLGQYLKQNRPKWRRVALMTAQVARALNAAHASGVLHRDVKPANILVTGGERCRLIDFGLALMRSAWQAPGFVSDLSGGTPLFMSPEQARALDDPAAVAELDCRSDVYSLGGVLFFALTGQAPYSGTTVHDVLEKVGNGAIDRGSLVRAAAPRALKHICLKALSVKREHRYDSALAMARALERFARRPKVMMVSTTALVILAAVLAMTVRNAVHPHPAVALAPPALQVQVLRDSFRDLSGCGPVYTGEKVRFRAEVPASMYGSLFLLDSRGTIKRLATKTPRDDDRTLAWPGPGMAVPLSEPGGTELIFVCARRSGPIGVPDLGTALGPGMPLRALPPESIVRVEPAQVTLAQASRSIGDPVAVPEAEDDVQSRLEAMRKELKQCVDVFSGLAFSHQAPE